MTSLPVTIPPWAEIQGIWQLRSVPRAVGSWRLRFVEHRIARLSSPSRTDSSALLVSKCNSPSVAGGCSPPLEPAQTACPPARHRRIVAPRAASGSGEGAAQGHSSTVRRCHWTRRHLLVPMAIQGDEDWGIAGWRLLQVLAAVAGDAGAYLAGAVTGSAASNRLCPISASPRCRPRLRAAGGKPLGEISAGRTNCRSQPLCHRGEFVKQVAGGVLHDHVRVDFRPHVRSLRSEDRRATLAPLGTVLIAAVGAPMSGRSHRPLVPPALAGPTDQDLEPQPVQMG